MAVLMPWEAGGGWSSPAPPPPLHMSLGTWLSSPFPHASLNIFSSMDGGDCVVFVSGKLGSQAILCYNLSKVDATPPPGKDEV